MSQPLRAVAVRTPATPPEPRKVYSYVRWSTPEQGDGDSLRRQTAKAAAWAQTQGLELADTRLQDAGVSAFHGDNIRSGALGAFLEAVRVGEIPRGSALYIENVDRLSREHPWEALKTLQAIIEAGIEIIDGSDGARYSKERILADGGHSVTILTVKMLRPYAESATKRERLQALWDGKRERARKTGEAMTSRCPGWLRKAGGGFEPISEKEEVVCEIFRMAGQGMSACAISEKLNREGTPVLGGKGAWRRQQISKLLSNTAVLGTFTPHTSVKEGGRRKRGDAGEPIPNYFPAIITQALWDSAQVFRGARPAASRGGVGNLFGRLLRCARCGAALTRMSKGRQNRGRSYLYCDARRHVKAHRRKDDHTGQPCDTPTIRYERFESGFLAALPSILSEGHVWSDIHLQCEIETAAAELAATDKARERLARTIERLEEPPEALLERLKVLEKARKEYAREHAELETELARLRSPAMHKQRVWLEAQRDLTRNRGQAALRLRTIIRSITVDTETGKCVVAWVAGGPDGHITVTL